MKRIIVAFLLLLLSASAHAASSCSVTVIPGQQIIFSWTADTDGSFTQCGIPSAQKRLVKGLIWEVWTNPGATAPTDNYDPALTIDGLDIFGGGLDNRDTANTERVAPLLATGTEWPAHASPAMVLDITGNSVDSAVGTVIIILR